MALIPPNLPENLVEGSLGHVADHNAAHAAINALVPDVNTQLPYALQRQNHTGTQTASTISDLDQAVMAILQAHGVVTATATGVPTIVSANGGDTTITISWSPPTSLPTGKTVASYETGRTDFPNDAYAVPAGQTYMVLTHFTNGTQYTVTVRSVFNDGSKSPWAQATATPNSGTTTVGSSPQPYPLHEVGMYHMCWTSSSYPKLSTTPAGVNVLYLAFMFNNGSGWILSDGGYAGETSASAFSTALQTVRNKGVRIIMALGGSSGSVPLDSTNRQSLVTALTDFSTNVCPLDGINWDSENSTSMTAFTNANVLAVNRAVISALGSNTAITYSPNGSNVDTYVSVAKYNQDNGVPVSGFGQQFYDAAVSDTAMKSRLDQYTGAGLPITRYTLGMMEPMTGDTSSNYWNLSTCITRLNSAKTYETNLSGAYLWERSRIDSSTSANPTTWAGDGTVNTTTVGGIIHGWT